MKNKHHTSLMLLSLCFVTLSTFAQSGLTVSAGSSIFISSGTVFSVDSLVLTPTAGFTINGSNIETRNTVLTHPSTNTTILRVFHFLNTLSSFTGAITIYYLDAELNTIPESLLTLYVNNGTSWNAYALNVTRDPINNFVTTDGLSDMNLNELTLTDLSDPLPIFFSLFNSACITGGVKLTWTTTHEFNSRNFNIEKSANGSNWQIIANVPASGNSGINRTYTFTDDNSSGNDFYRIAEIDNQGKQTYTGIIKSSCTTLETYVIHPNPVHDIVFVNINATEIKPLQLRLYDAKGALVRNLQTRLLKGANQLQLNMEGLAPGIYLLNANWGNINKTNKIVKE